MLSLCFFVFLFFRNPLLLFMYCSWRQILSLWHNEQYMFHYCRERVWHWWIQIQKWTKNLALGRRKKTQCLHCWLPLLVEHSAKQINNTLPSVLFWQLSNFQPTFFNVLFSTHCFVRWNLNEWTNGNNSPTRSTSFKTFVTISNSSITPDRYQTRFELATKPQHARTTTTPTTTLSSPPAAKSQPRSHRDER